MSEPITTPDSPPTSPPPPPPQRKTSNYLLLGVNLVILLFAVYIVWNRMQGAGENGEGGDVAIASTDGSGAGDGRGGSGTSFDPGPRDGGSSLEDIRIRGARPSGVTGAGRSETEVRLRGQGAGATGLGTTGGTRLAADVNWSSPVMYDEDTRRSLAATERAIDAIGVQLEVYCAINGNYPSSIGGEGTNRGVEALYDALEEAGRLGNFLTADTDGDGRTELVDLWGNPLVYFSPDDYGTSQDWTGHAGGTATVGSPRSRLRDTYQAPQRFQLWSAGPDAKNDGGVSDDVTSWVIRR